MPRKQNRFRFAVYNTPQPENDNTIIIEWDMNTKDFCTQDFDENIAKGRMTAQDLARMITEFKQQVKTYHYDPSENIIFLAYFCGGLGIGALFILLFAAIGLVGIGVLLFLVSLVGSFFYGLNIVINLEKKMDVRASELKKLILDFNKIEYNPKGINIKTNELVTYLEFFFSDSGRPINKPMSYHVPRSNDVGPRKLIGHKPGFNPAGGNFQPQFGQNKTQF